MIMIIAMIMIIYLSININTTNIITKNIVITKH